jgi:RNA polymerase sigma factor for flagellar operon FliA
MGRFNFSFSKEKSIKKMNNLYSQNSEISIEKLIEGNLDLVKKIAWQIHGRVHNVIEIEDLIQQGMEGLVHAAQKYSPRDNVTFPQYAQLRIRGSIIDYLRKNSNLCRTTIKKKQDFEKNKIQLENSLGRPPSQDEIVQALGISFDEYDYWQKSFEANSVQSLDNAYDEYSLLFATAEENPEEQLETKELKAEIKVALETLNQREALIAQLYYVEELNIYEISDILDISTGRISQIKKKIIEKLRNEIKK